MLIISKNTRTIINNKKILVANVKLNRYLKVNKMYYEIISENINKYGNIENLKKEIYDEKVKRNIEMLFSELCNIKVIVEENDELEKEVLDKVLIHCTNRCNLNCIHCIASSGIYEEDLLNTEEIKEIIDSVIKHKPKSIIFTGGEPLMRNDILEILKYTHKKFQGYIILNTNGILINKRNVNVIIQNVDSISLSLDGIDEETTSTIRGKGVFEKTISSIKLLQENKFNNISASMVITKYNYDLCDRFIELCDELNIKAILRKFDDIGRRKINKNKLLLFDNNFIKGRESVICNECKPGQREIYINYNGDIYPCQVMCQERFCLGNIKDNSLVLDSILEKENKFFDKIFNQNRSYNNTKYKNCIDNLFCWSSLGNYMKCSLYEKILEKECLSRKDKLIESI